MKNIAKIVSVFCIAIVAICGLCFATIGPASLGQYMGNNNMWWGSGAIVTVKDSLYVQNLVLPSNGFGLNKVLTSDAKGNAFWATNPYPNTILDTTYAGFAHQTLVVGNTYVITGAGTITADTITLPTGVTNNYIDVIFNRAVTTVSYGATSSGGGQCFYVAATAGQYKRFINIGGFWH